MVVPKDAYCSNARIVTSDALYGVRAEVEAAVSVRENERVTGIVRGSNPNHHEPTDKYENYGEEDFRFGFDSAQTTLGGLGQLAGITLVRPR
jgi:hypothetical protein